MRRAEQDPLVELIRSAKQVNVFDVPAWDDNVWDITASDKYGRGHNKRTYRLLFSEHADGEMNASLRRPFLAPFQDFAKAIISRQQEWRPKHPGRHATMLRVLRYIYHAAPEAARREPRRLTQAEFVEAERMALEREVELSAYKVGQGLEELSALIDRLSLTSAVIGFQASIRRPTSLDRLSADAEARRKKKLPQPDALDALAEIANLERLRDNPGDLIRMRAVELLFVCGFRIGEVLTLPKNPLVYEPAGENGEPRVGLRYWPEKCGDPIVKWIPTIAKELVERAINDIDGACESARKLAAWLERHPGTVKVSVKDDALLTKEQVARIVGVAKPPHVISWLRSRKANHIIQWGVRGKWLVRAGDLKGVMARDRFDDPIVIRADGKAQRLSGSLFVVFQNQLHPKRGTNFSVVQPLTLQHISVFLGSTDAKISAFSRYGSSGRRFCITTHAFRHLVNTMALRGGLSDLELARWMGRRHLGDNAAYDHRSASELAEDTRALIVAGKVHGKLAEMYKRLPEGIDRDEFLRTHVSAVHTTSLGGCVHNLAEMPCPVATSCLSGCGDYIRTKGDARSRSALETLRESTLIALQRAEAAATAGKHNALNWHRAHERTLANIERALAIDEEQEVENGAMVRINPDQISLGEAI